MKRVLLHETRKSDPIAWDATDEPAAFLAMFKHLHEDWDAYADLREEEAPRLEIPDAIAHSRDADRVAERDRLRLAHERAMVEWRNQRSLFLLALEGSAVAARSLCRLRSEYEYEVYSLIDVEPLA